MEPTTETLRSPAAFFDALAGDYDVMTDIGARLVRERPFFHVLVDRYDLRTAIDVGTGTGVHAVLMAQLGVRVTAVDISEEMLRIARLNASRYHVRVRTLRADVASVGETVSGLFDAAVCLGNTLVHLHRTEDLDRAFTGFRRFVQRNGVVVIQILNYAAIPADREVILSSREREGAVFERSYRPNGAMLEFRTTIRRGMRTEQRSVLHRPWTSNELVEALDRSGFRSTALFGGIDLKPFDASVSSDLLLISTAVNL
ncbi:MAG: class I SAM-dependent methyltransferase [Bacteroidetes bacterium]|jgi:ubiquinone/menaquinone biosynthesis C-methylase UbiE|nr:class I SAM-dependent methyltransferase [Bacteroidota bacterium]